MTDTAALSLLLYNLFVNYTFGSVAIALLAFMAVMAYFGVKAGWSIDSHAVVQIPLLILVAFFGLPIEFKVLIAIGGGFVLAYEMYKYYR